MISAKMNQFHATRRTHSNTLANNADVALHLPTLSYADVDYPAGSVQHRIWQEFVNGMQLLNQHVRRINADVTQIIRSNLRLLHSNLQDTQQYKELVNTAKQKLDKESLLSRWPIISNEQVQASLIRINQNIERSPNLATHLCYDYFNTSDDFQGLEPASSLFFVLSGKLCVEYSSELNKVLQQDDATSQPGLSVTSRVIKSGEVLINPQYQDNLLSMSNKHKNTLILATHIAYKT